MSTASKPQSVLDDLGEEITGVAWPVSICMAITIFLVRVLNPSGASSSSTVFIASAGYDENKNPDASSSEKLGGALLNAIIFICVIVGMTLLLVLLFKYECYRVIFAYMGFAVANIFFLITGLLIILLCQRGDVHVDAFSLAYILFNFSVVGTLGVLFMPIPLLMKQCYMVWVGIIVAYIFTWIPDWTGWVLLVAMALYDIAAVLIPGGPLKWLVELAVERQQAIPALVYESRPAGGYRGAGAWGRRRGGEGADDAEQPVQQEMTRQDRGPEDGLEEQAMVGSQSQQQLLPPHYQQQQQQQGGSVAPPGFWAGAAANGATGHHHDHHGLQEDQLEQQQQQQRQAGARPGQGGPVGEGMEPPPQQQQWQRPVLLVRPQPRDAWVGHPLAEGVEEQQEPHSSCRAAGLPSGVGVGVAPGVGLAAGAGVGFKGRGSRLRGPVSTLGPVAEGHQQDALQQPLVSSTYAGGAAADPDSPNLWRQAGGAPLVAPGSADAAAAGARVGSGTGYSPLAGPTGSGQSHSNASRRGGMNNSGTASVTSVVMGMASTAVAPAPMPPPAQQLASAGLEAQHAQGEHLYPGDGSHAPAQEGEQPQGQPQPAAQQRQADDDDDGLYLPDGIKLGLGDFIFYSMLVGKAAMYDMMTVYASFIGIIAGLGLTLLCLAIYQRALPALPFSIALGVVFYFLTRIVLEPYVVTLVTAGTYY